MEPSASASAGGPSVARALDDARALIAQRLGSQRTARLPAVQPGVVRARRRVEEARIRAGRAVRLLGLLVVSSPGLADSDIAVR